MEKELRLSVRIDKELKDAFFKCCESKQQTPSKVIKYLIQSYVDSKTIFNKDK